MDFDSILGKVRVSRRTRMLTDSTDDADLGLSWAFVRSSADGTDRWWAGCNAVLFKNTAGALPAASNFVQDTIATGDGTPTDLSIVSSDLVDYQGNLIVSTSTDLHILSGGSWDKSWWDTTLAQAALTTGIAHPLHISLKTNLLLVGDGNLLHTIDKNNNVKASRVILPSDFEIIWIRSTYDGSWIGARNKTTKEAKAFFWDESAENYNRGYGLKDDMTFACVIKDGVPYIVNGIGQLLKFTGSSFEEVAVFPVFNQVNKKWNDGNTVRRNIHRNGMSVIDGKIHINVCSQINNDEFKTLENFPSGIWTYDEKQGLRHKYGLSLYRATGGSEIDYGGFITFLAGALVATENSNGLFLAGATIGSDYTTQLKAIFYADPNEQISNRGHFITSIFESSAFEDIFKDILLTFRRFKNTGDKIVIKYRSIKNPNYPIIGTGTYTSTTVFTTTTSLANASAGDEVMIIRGKGSGATAKILSITEVGGTYTVTLEEVIIGATGTMIFLIGDWTEVAKISTQSIERQSFDLDVVGTFIQLKIELRSVIAGATVTADSPTLEKLVVQSTPEAII